MKVGARENVRQNGKVLWRKSKSNGEDGEKYLKLS
ncbi:hypothetical protein ABIB18_000283 [Pantoea sp. UYEF8]